MWSGCALQSSADAADQSLLYDLKTTRKCVWYSFDLVWARGSFNVLDFQGRWVFLPSRLTSLNDVRITKHNTHAWRIQKRIQCRLTYNTVKGAVRTPTKNEIKNPDHITGKSSCTPCRPEKVFIAWNELYHFGNTSIIKPPSIFTDC